MAARSTHDRIGSMFELCGDQGQLNTQPGRSVLLAALRDETAHLHEALESALGLTDPHLTCEHYAAVLSGFGQVVGPLEACIAQRLPPRLEPFFTRRRKAHCLRNDLAWLHAARPGSAAQTVRIDANPAGALGAAPEHLPAIRTAAEAFGAMYVLEGATLGGRIITRHLERRLGLSDGRGYSYFCAYGTEVGAMWQQFRVTLDVEVAPADHRSTIEAALHTFCAFRRHCAAAIANAAAGS